MILDIPNQQDQGQRITLDISEAIKAEGRVHEIALITPTKAPELLSVFVRACFELARVYSQVQYHLKLAEWAGEQRRAVVLLEEVPKQTADKKTSAEQREAYVTIDPIFASLKRQAIETEAMMIFVKGKLQAMEEALNAAKKALSDVSMAYGKANPELAFAPAEVAERTQTQTNNGLTIGKARY